MSTFLFTYRAPKNYTQGRPDAVAAWNAWFERIGANLVDIGKRPRSLSGRGPRHVTPR
jgi:hypothetical protein